MNVPLLFHNLETLWNFSIIQYHENVELMKSLKLPDIQFCVWKTFSTEKQPSPEGKPANQLGSIIFDHNYYRPSTWIIFGKYVINYFERPLFIEALIPTILCNPSIERGSSN